MNFLKTTASYRQGARTMEGRYYTSPEIYAEEQERIFGRRWICVGREHSLGSPGDFLTATIAGESLVVVRDKAGALHAFYNVCRHRGTRLCEREHGNLGGSIQCPYHAWTYGLDGRLMGAPHMNEVDGFDKADYPLHEASLATWEGFVFVTLEREAEPFEAVYAPVLHRFARYGLGRLVTVRRIAYDVKANWKLVLQNYNECLHCPTIHPELSTKLPYTSGANDLAEGPFLGGSMDIKPPNESATISGRMCALPLEGAKGRTGEGAEGQRAYYYALFPTMMLSLHPDYAVYYMVQPMTAVTSRVTCEWMVHPDAPSSPGYNITDAEEFWDVTNRQDWHICEQSQLGISSRVYQPGPYSPRESIPAAWDLVYLKAMRDRESGIGNRESPTG